MLRVSAIKNSVNRTTRIRPGGGISRVYHNVKLMTRMYNTMAGLESLLALQAAHHKWNFNIILLSGLMLYFAKKGNDFYKLKVDLKEYYQPIVDRAKRIYKR